MFRKRNPKPEFMIVGLGNPGDEYRHTRHNAGFLAVERLIKAHGMARTRRRYEGRWGEGTVGGRPVAILMPLTFMNMSGDAVAEAASRKNFPPEKIIVVHDDMDYPFGAVRVKAGGGDGGHKGLASITHELHSGGYARVRIGIGRPDVPDQDPSDWVLSHWDVAEFDLSAVLDKAVECVEVIISEGIKTAMNRCNQRMAEE